MEECMNKSVMNYGDVSSIFDVLFNDFGKSVIKENVEKYFSPRVDIRENDKSYMLEAELPGYKEDEINISIKDNILTLSCKKEVNEEKKNGNYLIKERCNKEFKRQFNFYDNINEEGIEAVFENGVLEVNIPKKEERKSFQIEVKKKKIV